MNARVTKTEKRVNAYTRMTWSVCESVCTRTVVGTVHIYFKNYDAYVWCMHFYGCILLKCMCVCPYCTQMQCNALLFDIGTHTGGAESLFFHIFLYEAIFLSIEKNKKRWYWAISRIVMAHHAILWLSACLNVWVYVPAIKLTSACISINNVFNNNLFLLRLRSALPFFHSLSLACFLSLTRWLSIVFFFLPPGALCV